MCVLSQQNPQEFHFENIVIVSGIWLHILRVFLQDNISGFCKGCIFLFIQKPHKAMGCQESEEFGKI